MALAIRVVEWLMQYNTVLFVFYNFWLSAVQFYDQALVMLHFLLHIKQNHIYNIYSTSAYLRLGELNLIYDT